jgi:hypothetical protein
MIDLFRQRPAYFILAAALFLGSILPIILAEFPPLLDYPNHIARLDILLRSPHDEFYQTYYEFDTFLIPNIGFEILSYPIAMAFGADLGGRIVLCLLVLLFTSSVLLLNYAIYKEFLFFPLSIFIFVYNKAFLFGFMSYLTGLSFGIFLLAGWILTERYGNNPLRIGAFVVLALLVYFSHLHAFLSVCIFIGLYEITRFVQMASNGTGQLRDLVIRSIPFLIPLIVFVASSTLENQGAAFAWGSLQEKVRSGVSAVFRSYNLAFDLFLAASFTGLYLFSLYRRHLKIDFRISIILAFSCIVFLLMPSVALSSSGADWRFALFILCIAVGGARLADERSVFSKSFLAFLAAVFVIRMVLVQMYWAEGNAAHAGVAEVIDKLPAGARVTPVHMNSKDRPTTYHPMLVHAPAMAVTRRSAYVSTIFAGKGVQVINVRKEADADYVYAASLHIRMPGKVNAYLAGLDLTRFDYILVTHPDLLQDDDMAGFELLYANGYANLYRID